MLPYEKASVCSLPCVPADFETIAAAVCLSVLVYVVLVVKSTQWKGEFFITLIKNGADRSNGFTDIVRKNTLVNKKAIAKSSTSNL